MRQIPRTVRTHSIRHRRGAATLDYVLILGTLIPLCGIALMLGQRLIRGAYEMISAMVSSPFF